MDDSPLYRICRPITNFLMDTFIRPKYVGVDNIPKEGRIILAGTHTHILDCYLIIDSTNRIVHFLAKSELWKGPKKIIFGNMGLISVDRGRKNPEAMAKAKEYLNNDLVIGIFPEGTTEKGRGLLPFKIGTVKMARDTNTPIIPFTITG